MEEFLDLARRGKNDLWRYIIGIILIFSFYLLGVIIPFIVALAFGLPVDLKTFQIIGLNQLGEFLLTMFTFITWVIGIFIVVKFLHKRPLLSLITPQKSIKWKTVLWGFILFFGLLIPVTIVEYILGPSDFRFNFNLYSFLIFLPFILILIPIQTTTEELFFRGYFLQGTGLLIRNFLILAIVNGIAFMLIHLGNPEISGGVLMMIYYAFVGLFLAFITLKSGSMELAIGVHAAFNLFYSLILGYSNAAFSTPSIFIKGSMDPLYTLISIIVVSVLFYLIVFKYKSNLLKWDDETSIGSSNYSINVLKFQPKIKYTE